MKGNNFAFLRKVLVLVFFLVGIVAPSPAMVM